MNKPTLVADPMLQAALKAGAKELVIRANGGEVTLRVVNAEEALTLEEVPSLLARMAANEKEMASLSNGVALKNVEQVLGVFSTALIRVTELLGVVQADQQRIVGLLESEVVPSYGADGRIKSATRMPKKPS